MLSQMVSLAWDGHHTTLVSVFGKFLEGCKLVDCTIVAEGQKLNAHKEVLSAFSPYFELLFREETENNPTVILSGINFRDIKSLVYFMYHGNLEVPENRIKALIDVAECLKIKGLGGAYDREGSAKGNKTSCLCKVLAGSSGIPHKRTRKLQSEEAAKVLTQEDDEDETNKDNRTQPHQKSSDAPYTHMVGQSSVENTMQNFHVQHVASERNVPFIPEHSSFSSFEMNSLLLNDVSEVKIQPIRGAVVNVMGTTKRSSSRMNLYESNGCSFERNEDSVLGLPSDLSVTSDDNHYKEVSQGDLNLQLFRRDLLTTSVRNNDHFKTNFFFPSVARTESAVETHNLFIHSELVKTEPRAENEIFLPEDNNIEDQNGERSETLLQGTGVFSVSVEEMLAEHNNDCESYYSDAGSRWPEEPVPSQQQLLAVSGETEVRRNNKSAITVLSGLVADAAESHAPRPATCVSHTTLCQSDVPGPSRSDSQMQSSSIDKQYHRQYCNDAFTRADQLQRHQRGIHFGLKPFKCPECNYASAKRSKLNIHKRTHSGLKPYKCMECNYAATRSDYLITHQRIHSGIKPYKCDQCDYTAAQRTHLKTHARIHSGIKPYKCTKCHYTSAQSSTLKHHMRSHIDV